MAKYAKISVLRSFCLRRSWGTQVGDRTPCTNTLSLQVQHLDALSGEDLLLTGEVSWRPLVESNARSILKPRSPVYNDEGLWERRQLTFLSICQISLGSVPRAELGWGCGVRKENLLLERKYLIRYSVPGASVANWTAILLQIFTRK